MRCSGVQEMETAVWWKTESLVSVCAAMSGLESNNGCLVLCLKQRLFCSSLCGYWCTLCSAQVQQGEEGCANGLQSAA